MLAELETLLPPPAVPVKLPPAGGWERIDREFGVLPSDYKRYIERYGTGFVGDGYLTIFNPFDPDRFLNLVEQAEIVRSAFQHLAELHPQYYDIPFYPVEGGYLPFGVNMDGAYLLWHTTGYPDDWMTAVIGSCSNRIHSFPTGMVGWLCNILSKRVLCGHFADDFPGDGATFDNR